MTTIPHNPFPLNQHHLHLPQVFLRPGLITGLFPVHFANLSSISVLQTVIFSRKLCWQGRWRPIRTQSSHISLLFLDLAAALRRAEGASLTTIAPDSILGPGWDSFTERGGAPLYSKKTNKQSKRSSHLLHHC